MIRIALVGCGPHAYEAHATPLARFVREYPGQIDLVAACDLDESKARRFCDEFKFARPYTDIDTMLAAEKPDVVHCIVPPPLVPDLSIKLLEKGIVTVVEKPLGILPRDTQRLLDAALRTGTQHLVSVNRRFMPRLWRGVNWAKALGPIEYIRCAMTRYHRNEPSFFWSTGMHTLDALVAIGGEVTRYTNQPRTGGSLARDWHCVDLQFRSGANARLDILPTTGQEEEVYELYGQDFSVRVTSYMRRGTSLRCWHKNVLVIDEASPVDEGQDVYRGEYDEVKFLVAALSTGQPLKPTIADVAPSQRIIFDLAEKAGVLF